MPPRPCPFHGSLVLIVALISLFAAPVSKAADGTSTPIPPPARRFDAAGAYEPVGDQLIIFGGNGETFWGSNETWGHGLSNGGTWALKLDNGLSLQARAGATLTYDSSRGRLILFGGAYSDSNVGTVYLNDIWVASLSGTGWAQLSPLGTPPPPRAAHVAVYDPAGDRLIVFGGTNSTTPDLGDAWELTLSGTPQWSDIHTSSSPVRQHAAGVLDPVGNRLVVFGGSAGGTSYNDVWALTLSTPHKWIALNVSGTPPVARRGHTAVYDPTQERMIIFGGSTQAFSGGQYDVWALNLSGSPQWTQISPSGAHPSGRTYQSAVWDSARNHMVMFGGYPNLNDLWVLDPVGGWSQVPDMPNPGLIEMPASFFDPVRERLVVFGGTDGTTFSNAVWTHSSHPNTPWIALNTNGTPPAARAGASFIYDSTRDRAVLFGGKDSALKNDVWQFDLGTDTWSQATPLGTAPPVRYLHSAIYDPVQDRMVVFGGGNSGMNDTWELVFSDPPIWNQLTPSGSLPAARIGQSAIFDPIRDRMIIAAGGYNAGFGANYFDDVWSLSLAGSPAWTQLSPLGTPPGERAGHCAIYDPVQDRMMIFGGGQPFFPFIGYMYNDLWELRLSGTLTWNALQLTGTLPPARAWQGWGYDSAQGSLLVFGGWGSQFGAADDTWLLHFSGVTTGIEPHELPVGIRVVASPNPVLARAHLQFKLTSSQPVTLSIHDITGRSVAVLVDRVLEAGDHDITWEPKAQSLGSGVYFYDLNAGNARTSGRLVLLR